MYVEVSGAGSGATQPCPHRETSLTPPPPQNQTAYIFKAVSLFDVAVN